MAEGFGVSGLTRARRAEAHLYGIQALSRRLPRAHLKGVLDCHVELVASFGTPYVIESRRYDVRLFCLEVFCNALSCNGMVLSNAVA